MIHENEQHDNSYSKYSNSHRATTAKSEDNCKIIEI
jgi:hypothetical protein